MPNEREGEGGGVCSEVKEERRTASAHLSGTVVSQFRRLIEQKAVNWERMRSGEERGLRGLKI